MRGRARAAQDLRAKGKVKALGGWPNRSIWRQRERASEKRDCFARSLKREFHGEVEVVIVLVLQPFCAAFSYFGGIREAI